MKSNICLLFLFIIITGCKATPENKPTQTIQPLKKGISKHTNVREAEFIPGLQKDVVIGEVGGVLLSINIALPENSKKQLNPAIIFIHGGGITKGNKSKFNDKIVKMAKLGIVSASVMYRFAPEHRFPAAIEDVKAAIRFMKAHSKELNLDPNRITVAGISSGGYLATMIGVTGNAIGFYDHGIYPNVDSSVRAVISQSGSLADFTNVKYKDFVLVDRFINTGEPDRKKALAAMSPLTYLDKNDPPFFLVHGTADTVVPFEMTREFAFELKKIDHEFEYIEVEGGEHSLRSTRPKEAAEVSKALMSFIKKYAFGNEAQ